MATMLFFSIIFSSLALQFTTFLHLIGQNKQTIVKIMWICICAVDVRGCVLKFPLDRAILIRQINTTGMWWGERGAEKGGRKLKWRFPFHGSGHLASSDGFKDGTWSSFMAPKVTHMQHFICEHTGMVHVSGVFNLRLHEKGNGDGCPVSTPAPFRFRFRFPSIRFLAIWPGGDEISTAPPTLHIIQGWEKFRWPDREQFN